MIKILEKEVAELRASNKDPISFAIEAIRINLCCYSYKDETILYEAMKKLEELKEKENA